MTAYLILLAVAYLVLVAAVTAGLVAASRLMCRKGDQEREAEAAEAAEFAADLLAQSGRERSTR